MTYQMLNTSMMSKTTTFAAFLVACAAFVCSAHAAEPTAAAGQAKAGAVCAACHGKDGNTPIDPSYPKIAGQHREFLTRALLDYKSGARKNAIMAGQAQALSRADIEGLADYYASLPGSLQVALPK
jgi:cytochrome c553